jgi:osmotically-inducible protein OsmY
MLNVEVSTMNEASILKKLRAALEREPCINLHQWPVSLSMTDEHALVMEGEVESVAAKKLALKLARTMPDVNSVVSRLHVAPTEHKGDGEIQEMLASMLLNAGELKNCTLRLTKKGQIVNLQEGGAEDASGDIQVSVKDAVVTLNGWAISLSHKRLAGVLAWWVPGCRDVVDGLEVRPPEQDNDDELSDALSLVLEMDPLIPHPDQIRVQTRDHVITLEGLVGSQLEKSRAEQDAWCLFDVDRVVNHLAVTP